MGEFHHTSDHAHTVEVNSSGKPQAIYANGTALIHRGHQMPRTPPSMWT
ncbi:MAG: hypothetical protein ACLR0P_07760 [Oscillospiraceae bacterium]